MSENTKNTALVNEVSGTTMPVSPNTPTTAVEKTARPTTQLIPTSSLDNSHGFRQGGVHPGFRPNTSATPSPAVLKAIMDAEKQNQ